MIDDLLGGWTLSGIQTYQSGVPISVFGGTSIPTLGSIWSDRVQGVPIHSSTGCHDYDPGNPARDTYLNINAFATPGFNQLGNTLVPSVLTCGLMDESFSLFKIVKVKEHYFINFGADFFNAFNRHMFYNINTSLNP